MDVLNFFRDITIVGSFTIIYVILQYTLSKRHHIAEMFLMLRKDYLSIHEALEKSEFWDIEDDQGIEYDNVDMTPFHKYWIQSFNEWYCTNKIYRKGYHKLWNDFYRHAIGSSLLNPCIRKSLILLKTSNYSFGSHKPEFLEEISSIIDDLLKNKTDVKITTGNNRIYLENLRCFLKIKE